MQTEAAKYVSKRYALQRYLGWTEEEVLENEKLWKEENAKKIKDKIGQSPAEDDQVGLGGVGIRPDDSGIEGLGGDEEAPPEGEEAGGDAGAAAPPAAAAPPGGEAPPAI